MAAGDHAIQTTSGASAQGAIWENADGCGVPAGNLAVQCFEAPASRTLCHTAAFLAGLGDLLMEH